MKKYLPTGNEQLSLPKLNEENIGVEDVTFLHMGCKGLIEIRGGESLPLMQPFAEVDGQSFPFEKHPLAEAWLLGARLHLLGRPIELEGSVLAPRGERGFAFQLRLRNSDASPHQVCFGLHGCSGLCMALCK